MVLCSVYGWVEQGSEVVKDRNSQGFKSGSLVWLVRGDGGRIDMIKGEITVVCVRMMNENEIGKVEL